MNLQHLKLFARIAALKNISLAGKELGLSPAVSSSHMHKLEIDLNTRLLHRSTRHVSLTEEGIAFLPHALNLLEDIETARASVGSGTICPQGVLRVTAPASFGRMHLLPALAPFMQSYPKLHIDLHLCDRMLDLVEGGFDIAIRDAALKDSTLIARKLAPVKRIICASPQYLAHFGEPLSPLDLHNHHCINFIGVDTWVFNTDVGEVAIKPTSVLQTDNGEAARDACIQGIGITISSDWCCYRQLQSGELIQILKDNTVVSNTDIWAVYPSSRLLAPKVRAFIDYYHQYFGQTPFWAD